MLMKAMKFVKLHLLNITSREDLARRYLKGCGIEIGAMHFPLRVPDGVRVRYVDLHSRDENVARFPEIDGAKVVETDYVEDGFKLASFADNLEDFVIANHVLEHASNPLGTLQNWSRVLKKNGVLFITLPNKNRCFDKERELTQLEHLVRDASDAIADPETLRLRNQDHYRQWVDISLPAAAKENPSIQAPSEEEREAWMERLERTGRDIHFHTFDYRSFKRMLDYYCSQLDPTLQTVRIFRSSRNFEFIAILKKLPPKGP
jgi:SAM-dependent methyltransferase